MTGNPVDAGRQPVATLAAPHASARSPRPRVRGRLALLLGGASMLLGLFPAQGGFVELVLSEAGTYPFVSHVMSDAEKGAHGLLRVSEAG